MSRALAALFLAGVFVVATGSLAPGTLALALGVGAVLAPAVPRAATGGAALLVRVAWLPWLLLGVGLELARGAVEILPVLLGRAPHPGTVRVPFGERGERGAAVTALVASATPGTVLLELDRERRAIVLTALDARDPERARRQLDRFYRRFQRRVVP